MTKSVKYRVILQDGKDTTHYCGSVANLMNFITTFHREVGFRVEEDGGNGWKTIAYKTDKKV